MTFNGAQNLKISASGSDRSKGQDGGDGAYSRKGNDVDVKNHLYDCYKNTFKWHCAGEEGQVGGSGGNGGVGRYGGYAGEIKIINLGNSSNPNNYVAHDAVKEHLEVVGRVVMGEFKVILGKVFMFWRGTISKKKVLELRLLLLVFLVRVDLLKIIYKILKHLSELKSK